MYFLNAGFPGATRIAMSFINVCKTAVFLPFSLLKTMFHNQTISVISLLENSLTKAVIFNVAIRFIF